MKIIINKEEDNKKRLDTFLVEHFNHAYGRNLIASCIEKFILVNDKKQKSSYKIKLNDEIEIDELKLNQSANPSNKLSLFEYPLDIIYEDDDVIVINKPKNMLTHPTKFDNSKTLVNVLLFHCKDNLSDIGGMDRKGIVHRLDKNTAGLIICAKNNDAHENLSRQIQEKSAKRKYLAIALGNFEEKCGEINKPLKHYIKDNVKMVVSEDETGLSALTYYNVLEEYQGASLVELELKTGRTHQIRAHLSHINHPIFGDSLYGAKSYMRNEFYNLKTTEQLLQSYYLSFVHPTKNKFMEFQLKESQFSKDFIKVLNFLRRNNNV